MARDCYQFPKHAEIVHIERGGATFAQVAEYSRENAARKPAGSGQISLRKSLQNPVQSNDTAANEQQVFC